MELPQAALLPRAAHTQGAHRVRPRRGVQPQWQATRLRESSDATVKLWGRRQWPGTAALKGHTNEVNGVAFSPDGKRLASASEDATVKLWDATDGQEMLTLKGHTDWVMGVAFSPRETSDSPRRALTRRSNSGTSRLARNCSQLRGTPARSWAWRSAPTASDSPRPALTRRLGSGTPPLARNCSHSRGTPTGVTGVAFNPDGKRLASASGTTRR